MIVLNVILMSICLLILIAFLLATRKKDNCQWWAMRTLLIYSLIVNVYMLYDAVTLGDDIPTGIIMTRFGFFSLVMVLVLGWHLMHTRAKQHRKQRLAKRIADIFSLN